MKYIEIDSSNFWFYHYNMDATNGETVDNISLSIYDNKKTSYYDEDLNSQVNELTIQFYSKNELKDENNQLGKNL